MEIEKHLGYATRTTTTTTTTMTIRRPLLAMVSNGDVATDAFDPSLVVVIRSEDLGYVVNDHVASSLLTLSIGLVMGNVEEKKP